MTREQFTAKYFPMAVSVTRNTGIFPEVLIAIAIIETQRKDASGNYQPGKSVLATKANNYFAIKATPNWNGNTIRLSTPKDSTPVSTFRAYPTPAASFADFIKFLKTNPRYTKAGVFRAQNWQDQIMAIARAGYAEGADYDNKLISIVRRLQAQMKGSATALTWLTPIAIATLLTLAYIFANNQKRRA